MDMSNSPPTAPSPRFTLELEFVLALSNPFYLSHLAQNYPHLLSDPSSQTNTSTTKKPITTTASSSSSSSSFSSSDNSTSDTPAACFARYLAYLHRYWRTPQYSQYLTHPGAVLRTLELLQQERFRRDIIRPDVVAKLLEGPVEMDAQRAANGVGGVDQVSGKGDGSRDGVRAAANG